MASYQLISQVRSFAPSLSADVPASAQCRICACADFDDTLVQTSDHDKRAWAAIRELAASKLPNVDGEKLIADFKVHFKAVPWDPDYKVSNTSPNCL